MNGRGTPIQVGSRDPGHTRCLECNTSYDGYAWSECPGCAAAEGYYALRCCRCRKAFTHRDSVAFCPKCGSGETYLIAEPPASEVIR